MPLGPQINRQLKKEKSKYLAPQEWQRIIRNMLAWGYSSPVGQAAGTVINVSDSLER